MKNQHQFIRDLALLINKYNGENESDTPDFILAQYLFMCLEAFNATTNDREMWLGHTGFSFNDLTDALNYAMNEPK